MRDGRKRWRGRHCPSAVAIDATALRTLVRVQLLAIFAGGARAGSSPGGCALATAAARGYAFEIMGAYAADPELDAGPQRSASGAPGDTPAPELDRALSTLRSHGTAFARASLTDKVAWLRE